MAFFYFLAGFLTAVFLTAILLAVIWIRLKRNCGKGKTIQGYLDLIPDLTPEQRLEVQEIRRTFLPRVEKIRDQLRRKRGELADLLFAEPAERPAIDAATHEILRCQSDVERAVIEHILEEKALLSPSQKRQFHQIIIDQFREGGLGVHDIKGRGSLSRR